MNLQQTIADLEKQAAQYTEAANALRALLQNDGSTQDGIAGQETASKQIGKAEKKGDRTKAGKKGGKRTMSAEARARIGAATRARHQQKKQGHEAQEGQEG